LRSSSGACVSSRFGGGPDPRRRVLELLHTLALRKLFTPKVAAMSNLDEASRLTKLKQTAASSVAEIGSLSVNDKNEIWFAELSEMWPGQAFTIQVKQVLFHEKSKYQDVLVFESFEYGNVLVLDGVIQCTDRDEFSYQEMITHLPLCSLRRQARKVLVIGGGDGGVLREITRHEHVETIEICELDEMVPRVAKEFFPKMAAGFDDPRVKCHFMDGFKFLAEVEPGTYDAIIVDSSDPVGPAASLFQKPFFDLVHRALSDEGVVCTQAESIWLHLDIIRELHSLCLEVFQGGTVSYAYCTIPTYPSGQIGFMMSTKAGKVDFSDPKQALSDESSALLRYYSPEIHRASFVLPRFAKDALNL